jgi:hypothetical protein
LTVGGAAVQEQVSREESFGVSSEVAVVPVFELGVVRDGVLETLVSELSCDGVIVLSGSELVGNFNELLEK